MDFFLSIIKIAPNATISDIDSPNASSLIIIITTLYTGDNYSFPIISGLNKTQNNQRITYTGSQPLVIYENLLRSISFADTNVEPHLQKRELSFIVYTPISGNGGSAPSNVTMATIEILPVNDQVPVFNQSSYSGRVDENSPVGTPVGVSVAASDGDLPINQITYSISGSGASYFNIDPMTGLVTTAAVFDAEVVSSLSFNVTAEDTDGSIVQSATVPVMVAVADLNDNVPMFDLPFYQVNVSENTTHGKVILTVSASDSDVSSVNSALTYSLRDLIDISGSAPSLLPFAIDPVTGVIMLSGMLDYEKEQRFDFFVTCEDSGSPSLSSSVPVTVHVSDANDNAPVFDQDVYKLSISEDLGFGSPILTVQARDSDSGLNSHVTYELSGTVTFIIDSISGVITLAGELDYETEREVVFTVLARDSGVHEQVSSAIVNVTITNVNDNPPSFLSDIYQFAVYENTVQTHFAVSASDPDNTVSVLNALTYSILSSCLNETFTIGSHDGMIRLLQPLDRESHPICMLRVGVSDSLHSASATVNITVLDVNDNHPSFDEALYQKSIPEIYPVGTFVITVSASDPDEGKNGTITYTIGDGNVAGAFSVSPQGGIISVNGSLDHEVRGFYNLTLIATDGGGLSGTSHVLVTVTDRNDESPLLVISNDAISYTEETGVVPIAESIQVIDPDVQHNSIQEATIILSVSVCQLSNISFVCPQDFECFYYCGEGLALNKSLYGALTVSYASNVSTVSLNGEASPSAYQSILSSLSYFSTLPEPVPGNRFVEVSVFDGVHHSNTLAINVTMNLIDDNCPIVAASVSPPRVNYTEGDPPLNIGEGLGLLVSDSDQHVPLHQMLSGMIITLYHQNEGLERLSVNTTGLPFTVQDTNSVYTIRINGFESVTTYQNILRTLTYNNTVSEPTQGPRLGTISPIFVSGSCSPYSLNYTINVLTVNDNPPLIVTNTSLVDYREETGSLGIVQLANFTLTDPDVGFPILDASIFIASGDIRDIGQESLTFDSTLIPPGANLVEIFDHVRIGLFRIGFFLTGYSTVTSYEGFIRSVRYTNTAPEPTPGNRTLTISVFDGKYIAQTSIIIRVLILNDNPLELNGSIDIFSFFEGNSSLQLSGFMLYDPDEGAQVHELTISLSNTLETGRESISVMAFGSVESSSNTINLTTVDNITTYQVSNLIICTPKLLHVILCYTCL